MSPGPCTLTPHFGGTRDRRFERTCTGLRHDCTWNWEVLDDQLRAHGVDQPEAGKSLGERIVIDVPRAGVCTTPRPLSVYFTATLGTTAGLDAIDGVHRSHWAPQAMQNLQNAFDRAHPAIQILHHIVRIDIPDLGSMINADGGDIYSSRSDTDSNPGVNASRGSSWTGELRVALNQDAGLIGRRGDEDEEGNSDEDSADEY
ncbi:hypothetical protein BDV93DRAFT_522987 [Ceratobasidium sp. AG-I]|nr:hypothetical protein BDV93DRAFT_522987 [Ceratobasidium sp. AG-I]